MTVPESAPPQSIIVDIAELNRLLSTGNMWDIGNGLCDLISQAHQAQQAEGRGRLGIEQDPYARDRAAEIAAASGIPHQVRAAAPPAMVAPVPPPRGGVQLVAPAAIPQPPNYAGGPVPSVPQQQYGQPPVNPYNPAGQRPFGPPPVLMAPVPTIFSLSPVAPGTNTIGFSSSVVFTGTYNYDGWLGLMRLGIGDADLGRILIGPLTIASIAVIDGANQVSAASWAAQSQCCVPVNRCIGTQQTVSCTLTNIDTADPVVVGNPSFNVQPMNACGQGAQVCR